MRVVRPAIASDDAARVGNHPQPLAAAIAAPSDEASTGVERSTGRAVASARGWLPRSGGRSGGDLPPQIGRGAAADRDIALDLCAGRPLRLVGADRLLQRDPLQ